MKKIISIMLTLLIVIGFAGCGSKETPEPEVTPAVGSEPDDAETEPSEAPIDEEEAPENEPDEAPQEEIEDSDSEDDKSSISVVLTQDGSVLTLGDDRASIEAILGEGIEKDDSVGYFNDTFRVSYEDDIAIYFVSTDFEQVTFPAFDADRSISSLMLELTFPPFMKSSSQDHTYMTYLDVEGQSYLLMVVVGLINNELSHISGIMIGAI